MTSELIIDVKPKEISIALLEDKNLVEYQREARSASFSVGNIYIAKVKKLMPECVSIFILPPSMQVLEKRLRGRGTEEEATIQQRLAKAREEIPHAKEYDYVVFNDRLEDAVSDLRAIIHGEKLKFSRNTDSIERVLEHA